LKFEVNQIKKMKEFLTIIIILIISGCSNAQIQQAENGLINANTQLTEEQTELVYEKTRLFPNNTQVSLALIDNGEVKFLGIKRLNDTIQQVENQNKVFEIGSISKVFTATLLATFVVNGKLGLDHSIQKFFDFKMNADQEITFKELANHTSGLPRLPSNLNLLIADPNNPYKNYDEEKLKQYLTEEMEVRQSPGTKFEYSNLGAGLLGYILANYSKSTYHELLDNFIFSKYGMFSSTANREKIKGELVKGLDKDGNETSNWDLNVLVGAGGILSSTEDLSKFALAQLNPENEELVLTQQPTFTISDRMKIGLGWHMVKMSFGNEVIWHNGGTGGYTSSMAIDLKNKSGVIILSNVSAFSEKTGHIDDLCFGLIDTMGKQK
jgi:CubicO group peptidase (beta-lactamase class C family)